MADTADPAHPGEGETRRDFLYLAAAALGAVGTGAAVWPLIDSMNPSAEVLALASTEVDLAPVETGQRITVVWRGKPVYIYHRSEQAIEAARADNDAEMPDPQPDSARVKQPEWLVVIGICTHLGCLPKGQRAGDPTGEWGGWFCPCHGSHYDTSGRIRKGPAPRNLAVPPYEFTGDETIRIG
ncbi:MAG TPA: ubiquinol-cytochrome c reductase iron-sulfur subunit [Kiloniellales bacterium]|nr:ubiquinol-cytochrome c reductase iron-sulfur subunit [Kiloniellales bacterium]